MNWPELHDASLEDLNISWQQGSIVLTVIYFDSGSKHEGKIAGENLSKICLSREFPWGESRSINETLVRNDSGQVLRIEMQSGDEILVHAELFRFEIARKL